MSAESSILTRDAWIEKGLYWVDGNTAEFWGKLFDEFEGHPQMMEFLTYENSRQSKILKGFALKVSTESIVSFLEICHRMDSEIQKLSENPDPVCHCEDSIGWQKTYFYCDELTNWQLENLLDRMFGPASEEFNKIVREMNSLIDNKSNLALMIRGYQIHETFHLLRSLYDEELIIEITTRCLEYEIPLEVSQMIQLADQWEVSKDYPIDWAVSLTR